MHQVNTHELASPQYQILHVLRVDNRRDRAKSESRQQQRIEKQEKCIFRHHRPLPIRTQQFLLKTRTDLYQPTPRQMALQALLPVPGKNEGVDEPDGEGWEGHADQAPIGVYWSAAQVPVEEVTDGAENGGRGHDQDHGQGQGQVGDQAPAPPPIPTQVHVGPLERHQRRGFQQCHIKN
jgi:hypothetical protein